MAFHVIDRDDGNIPHGRKRLREIDAHPERGLKPWAVGDGYRINIGLSMVSQKGDEDRVPFRVPFQNRVAS